MSPDDAMSGALWETNIAAQVEPSRAAQINSLSSSPPTSIPTYILQAPKKSWTSAAAPECQVLTLGLSDIVVP